MLITHSKIKEVGWYRFGTIPCEIIAREGIKKFPRTEISPNRILYAVIPVKRLSYT